MAGRIVEQAGARFGAGDAVCARPRLVFRSVNRRVDPGYRADMQRHHLLPRQLLCARYFARMFESLHPHSVDMDDFRTNGLLLPASSAAALQTGLPLHRGPHRTYNELVAERVGQVEAGWQRSHLRSPIIAREEALLRLDLLQRALRRRLMQRDTRKLLLSRKDPFRAGIDFTELDAMAEALWSASAIASS